jgi:Armadillo/beta-catenin-like repeat
MGLFSSEGSLILWGFLQRYSCNREHAGMIAQTSGALKYLVCILQQNYLAVNDPSKAAAAFSLQNLAYHSSATRERISQAGAIPVLVQLLQSPDDTVREAAAGTTLLKLVRLWHFNN